VRPCFQDVEGGPPAGTRVRLVVPGNSTNSLKRDPAKLVLLLAGLLPPKYAYDTMRRLNEARAQRRRPLTGCLRLASHAQRRGARAA
jgi:hypothetical protein